MFKNNEHPKLAFMGFFWLFLVCFVAVSCLGSPLEVTGWTCQRAEECGEKDTYRCQNGRCERRCVQPSDCNGAATCREGWCSPNFLERPVASHESNHEQDVSETFVDQREPISTDQSEPTPTDSAESIRTEMLEPSNPTEASEEITEPIPSEPPLQETDASVPEPTIEPLTEIHSETIGSCTKDSDCPSRSICLQSRCSACQKDSDCSATYGGGCVAGSCEIAARQQNGVWSWPTVAPAVDCAAYRFPPSGYRAATQDGIYRLQPPQATAFEAYCEMTYAGGGWTLLLKSDGSKDTFRYDAPLWGQSTPYPASPNPQKNTTEAKLQSYATTQIKELLIQMADNNGQSTRSLIVRHEGPSLRSILQSPENTPFQTRAGYANWLGLVRGGSLQGYCRLEGINVARNATASNGYIAKLRLGILANNENDCGSIDSFAGIGAMYGQNAFPVYAGNANLYVGPNQPNIQNPRWTYILGRELRQTKSLRMRDNAYEYDDGTQAPSCQAYHLPPAAAFDNGVYWIKPIGQSAFRAYCWMDTQGGGWTLALKSHGTSSTFAYDSAFWTNTTTHNPNAPDLDTQEAKLASFHQIGFSQMLLSWQPLNGASTSRRTLLLHKSAPSLQTLFQGNNTSFDYALGSEVWKSFADGAQLQAVCEQEGINLSNGSPDDAQVRVGIFADGASRCVSPNSRIGMGAAGQSCGQRGDITVGASYGGTCTNETPRHSEFFGALLIR